MKAARNRLCASGCHYVRFAWLIPLLLIASPALGASASWQSTLTTQRGDYPNLRPLRAKYVFGWAGITAASADVHFTQPSSARFQLEAAGRTVGLARALWKLDVRAHAVADAETLRPMEVNQTEDYRRKTVVTHLNFGGDGVRGTRTETKIAAAAESKAREFKFANLFDLHSALLFLRSQPLRDRSVYRVVVYPATSAYLATITVVGREKVSVRAGTYNAIKADLQLHRLGKNLELEPHRKFRRATAWISDDQNRILLRVEAQIFIGRVFAELQAVRFET
ncbi:MAG TPA: DUF3108 domain-containing protein [Chthoniobacterales bacterium]|nr:DUF3108 domain-containing protein [Chthoniobacterales bacterium]